MKIEGTRLHADRFNRTASAILISHYHSDHLGGLRAGVALPPVLCSPLTARLLTEVAGLDMRSVIPIEPGRRCEIKEEGRTVSVTALEANHCPGSLMFLIEWDGGRALYTGDFRLNDAIRQTAAHVGAVDTLYVDATYDDPRYHFPPQDEAVERVVDIFRGRGDRVACIATYSIGKNRIIEAVCAALGMPFYMPDDRRLIYETLGMGHLVAADRDATPLRAYGRGYLEKYFLWSEEWRSGRALAVIPTGWALDRPSRKGFHYVPYSEHCDHAELQEFLTLVPARHVRRIH